MADRRERQKSLLSMLRAFFKGEQANIWTMLPGVVKSWDPATNTVEVQPTIKCQVQQPDGTWEWVQLPLCTDCPVRFPGGGDFVLTFPIRAGDEGTISFASRCIDSWSQSGGIQQQAELRMHDLSDGFYEPRVFSQPNVPTNISTSTAQLRSIDGGTYIEIAAGGVINIKAATMTNIVGNANVTGNLNVDGEITWPHGAIGGPGHQVHITGDLLATGEITAKEGASSVSLSGHSHSGVVPGGGSSGPPVGGT